MRIGFCHGVFDLLHEGHLHFLQVASMQCDYLIVGVNHDDSVKRLKGSARPIQPLEWRLATLADRGSPYTGAVIPFDGAKRALLSSLRPNVYIHGYDQKIDASLRWRLLEIQCAIFQVTELVGHSTSLQLAQAKAKTSA